MADLSSPKSWRFDWWRALLYSALFHVVLLLLLAFLPVRFRFEPPEFTEISFAAVSSPSPARQPAVKPPAPAEKPVTQQPSAAQQADRGSELIKLPKRRMLETEEPKLTARDAGKLSPTEVPSALVPDKIEARSLPSDFTNDLAEKGSDKLLPTPVPTQDETKAMPAPTPRTGTGKDQPFVIEGEAAKRTILVKVIPKYPEGVNREAVVRIRFTVLPNGMVGRAVLVRKSGEPILERITLAAFRQWRFNALPPDVPQVEQEGIITFRWVLK
ncbi:MAG: TonB family protein [Calditrichaeota bacterium]|nr:TonB family protein [Calditrichota bacterium]